MALLDMQAMEPVTQRDGKCCGGGSDLSVLLCDSTASVSLCL
jgi:hypothetical protein